MKEIPIKNIPHNAKIVFLANTFIELFCKSLNKRENKRNDGIEKGKETIKIVNNNIRTSIGETDFFELIIKNGIISTEVTKIVNNHTLTG